MVYEHKELSLHKLISKHDKFIQSEIETIIQDVKQFCTVNEINIEKLLTVTFGTEKLNEKLILDLEILIYFEDNNYPTILPQGFIEKKEIRITNALNLSFKGAKSDSIQAFNEINTFLISNKLQAITPVYSVSNHPFDQNEDTIDLDLYIGINPNII